MIKLFESSKEQETFLEQHSDPFLSDKVECIRFRIDKDWNGKVQNSAVVEFKNGDTKGEHKIKADNFPDLVMKVEVFLKSLK